MEKPFSPCTLRSLCAQSHPQAQCPCSPSIVTCHHDGADVGVPQEADHGLGLWLEDVFHNEEPKEGQAALCRVPVGIQRAVWLPNRSGSTHVNRPIHPGGSQQLLQHGVGFNCLQAARMGQLAGQHSTKHPLKYLRRAGDPTTAICRSCCRKAPAHHHVTGVYGYFASTRAACSRKEGLGLTLPLGLSRPGPFPCSLAACYSQSWKRQPALMETAHEPVP